MNVVRCGGCGGAIGVVPGRPEPRCLFCGSEALAPTPAAVEPPEGRLPFTIDEAAAQAAFRAYARASFFAPSALRDAPLTLRRLLIPAWSWDGRLDVCWTGLVRAMTKSGKRPVAGREAFAFDDVLVPASATLTQAELSSLGAFGGELAPWSADGADDPWEVHELSRDAARAAGLAVMRARAADALAAKHALMSQQLAARGEDLVGRPVLLPVWIGVYTWEGTPRRVLVHGREGRVVGRRPVDPWKVALVVGAALLVVLGIVAVALLAR